MTKKPLKGMSHQILWGLFWPAWIGLDEKGNLYGYIFLLLLRFFTAIFKFWRIYYQYIPKIPEMNLLIWGSGSRRFPTSSFSVS